MPDDFLDAAKVRADTFLRHIEIYDTLGSTNDRAIDLARELNVQLPALVAARNQTAGRGRGENVWFAADGALTFSILLDPAALGIRAANWPQLSLATAVAVCDALASQLNSQSQQLAIKWPNDVMLDGAKLAGILVESPGGAAPANSRLIIGIGINVNNSMCDPRSTSHGRARHSAKPVEAVALCDVSHREHSLKHLLCQIANALQIRIAQLSAGDPQLPNTWQRLCWLRNQKVEVQSFGRSIEGVCLGTDRDGMLLVEDVFEIRRIHSGTVRVRS